MSEPRTNGGFQPIGAAIVPIRERIDRLRRLDQERRIETIEARGWPETVQCLRCGDSGHVWTSPDSSTGAAADGPDATAVCDCDAGQRIREQRDLVDQWRIKVPSRFAGYSLDTSPQRDVADTMRHWIAREPWLSGENVLLFGPTGTGKTGIGIGAIRAAHFAGVSADVIFVSEWLDRQRPPASDESGRAAMDSARRPQLLLIDDVGTQKNSEWVHERLYLLIDDRYRHERATIVTTNHVNLASLANSLGERATSRLLEQCEAISVDGSDLRTRRQEVRT